MTIPSGVKGRRSQQEQEQDVEKLPKIVAYGCFDTVCTAPLGPKLFPDPYGIDELGTDELR